MFDTVYLFRGLLVLECVYIIQRERYREISGKESVLSQQDVNGMRVL